MANLWVLGAADPEMEASERLLRDAGEQVAYAVGPDGERVTAGNAYRAIGWRRRLGDDLATGWSGVTHLVECAPERLTAAEDAVVVDHHHPGDPGYGRPPAEFLPASSIGQVIAELARSGQYGARNSGQGPAYSLWGGKGDAIPGGFDRRESYGSPYWCVATTAPSPGGVVGVSSKGRSRLTGADMEQLRTGGRSVPDGRPEHMSLDDRRTHDYADSPILPAPALRWVAVPTDVVLAAAADHCLAAAYRGECPGVDPDALMRWRVETRAAFQRRPVEAVLADVEQARTRLRRAITDAVAGTTPDTHPIGEYAFDIADLRGESIPELPEAAAREGIPFLASVRDQDGREKVVLQAAPADLVARFLAGEIVAGLTGLYGDPARGFAGAYMQETPCVQ